MQKIGPALVSVCILSLLCIFAVLLWYANLEAPDALPVEVPVATTTEAFATTTVGAEVSATSTPVAASSTKTPSVSSTSTAQATPTPTVPKAKAYPVATGATDAEKIATFGKKLMNAPAWGPEEGRSVILDTPHLVITQEPPLPDAETIPYPESEIRHIFLSTRSDLDISQWKTFTNQKYHFTFQYPADWVFMGSDLGKFYDSTQTYAVAEVGVSAYDVTYELTSTLEKTIEFKIGTDIFGYTGKEKILLNKIADDEHALGYYSQRKIVLGEWLGWPYVETRLDFDQKKQAVNANGQGIFRIKVHIKNNMWYKDTEVFEKIASTFRFTGE